MSIFKENFLDYRLLKNLEKLCRDILENQGISEQSISSEELLKLIYSLELNQMRIVALRYGLKSDYSRRTLDYCAEILKTERENVENTIKEALEILRNNMSKYYFPKGKFEKTELSQEYLIENLNLPIKIYNILKRAGINYVEQISELSQEELYKIPGIGKKRAEEIWNVIH